MSNAKTEFQEFVKEVGVEVLCVQLEEIGYFKDDKKQWNLPVGYTKQDMVKFCGEIDFEYDDGFGSQELGGTIWFKDGTYADRGAYDGSEWWEYHKTPEIPPELSQRLSKTDSQAEGSQNASGDPKRKANT